MLLKQGITLLEVLAVVAIAVILATMGLSAISEYTKQQALESSARTVRSVFEKARSNTLASKGGSQYGLYFTVGSSTVTMFKGDSYLPTNNDNETFSLDNRVKILSFRNLDVGSSTEVVFERLLGSITATGTVVLSLFGDEFATTGVQYYGSGISADD